MILSRIYVKGLGGQLFISRYSPRGLEEKRHIRIRVALKKCVKLRKAKKPGAASVLVLELNDIQLGDPGLVVDAVLSELSKLQRVDIPDEPE